MVSPRFIAILLVVFSVNGFAKSFEQRVHEIYRSKEMQPISDEDWLIFGREVSSDIYTVQKGDTLWGLSQVFFGNGLYWSKVWSFNRSITNPHLIQPGAVLRFFPGSFAKPPKVTLSANTAAELEGQSTAPSSSAMVKNNSSESSGDSQDTGLAISPDEDNSQVTLFSDTPVIPPPSYIAQPVRPLPDSFQSNNLFENNYGKDGIKFDVKPQDLAQGSFYPSTFVSEVPLSGLSPLGQVVEIELGQEVAGYGTMVYIDSDTELNLGQNLLAYNEGEKVSGPGGAGRLVRVAGSLKVTEVIGPQKYRALVTGAFFPVPQGAHVFTASVPIVDPHGGRPSAKEFPVFAGEAWDERKMMGVGEIIFLSGGQQDGVAVGDRFGIYKNRKKRYSSYLFKKTPVPTAIIKVFNVQDRISSAVIVSSSEDVQIGDTTGSPDWAGAETF